MYIADTKIKPREKRSISEVVKDFNNNIALVKWCIIWLVASAILEN
jgi:hypothetical protein